MGEKLNSKKEGEFNECKDKNTHLMRGSDRHKSGQHVKPRLNQWHYMLHGKALLKKLELCCKEDAIKKLPHADMEKEREQFGYLHGQSVTLVISLHHQRRLEETTDGSA